MAYFCLLVLLAIAVTYQIRTDANAAGVWLHPNEHVRDPFELGGPNMAVILVEPEARAAGLRDGDVLTGIRGRPLRGFADYYAVLRQARPGQKLQIQVRPSTPGGTAPKNVSIELQTPFPRGPQASDWLSFALEDLAIPILCFALGFWFIAPWMCGW